MKKAILFGVSLVFAVNTTFSQSIMPSDKGMKARTACNELSGYPGTYYKSNYHTRGWNWNLYSMKCPLAWEITKGSDKIFIGAQESLGSNTEHPDMKENFTLIAQDYGNNTQTIRKQGIGDSQSGYYTEYLRGGHGLSTLSSAIAARNFFILKPFN